MSDTSIFNAFTDRLKVYVELINELGEYKLNLAKSYLEIAKAEEIIERIEARRKAIDELEISLTAFRKDERKIRLEIEEIELDAKNLAIILRGRAIGQRKYIDGKTAYLRFFDRSAFREGFDDVYDMEVGKKALSPANFVGRIGIPGPTDDAPSYIDNPLQLIDWILEMEYLPRAGSRAQRAVLKLLRAMNSIAQKDVDELMKVLRDVQSRTLDISRAIALPELPVSGPAQKIQSTTVEKPK